MNSRQINTLFVVYILISHIHNTLSLSSFGKDTVGSRRVRYSSNLFGNIYTISECGNATNLMVYMRLRRAVNLKGALYHYPNQSLIVSTPILSHYSRSWVRDWFNLTFPIPARLANGSQYILVVWVVPERRGRSFCFYDVGSYPYLLRSIDNISLPFPDPGGFTLYENRTYSIYCEYRTTVCEPTKPTTKEIITSHFEEFRSVWMDLFLLIIIIISFTFASGMNEDLLLKKIVELIVSTAVIILVLNIIQNLIVDS